MADDFDVMQERLEADYAAMLADTKVIREEIAARHAETIRQEQRVAVERVEARFAAKFVAAREGGMPRYRLAEIIRTNDSGKFRKFVELGGGTIREKLSDAERAEKQMERARRRVEQQREKSAAERAVREELKAEAERPMTAEEREAVFAAAGLVETHEGGMWWPEGEREVRFRLFEGVPRLSFLAYTTFATSERERLIEHDNAHRDELAALHDLIESEKK